MYQMPTVYEMENQTKLARLLLWEALLAAREHGQKQNKDERFYISIFFSPEPLSQGPWEELFKDYNRSWLKTCGRKGALRSATLTNYLGLHTTTTAPWESEHRLPWIKYLIQGLFKELLDKQYALEGRLFYLSPEDYKDPAIRRKLALLLVKNSGFGDALGAVHYHICNLYKIGV